MLILKVAYISVDGDFINIVSELDFELFSLQKIYKVSLTDELM